MTPVGDSCVGCAFLYKEDSGYSNYTVTDTTVKCAVDRNANLPADDPYDWTERAEEDNWPATQHARCEVYTPGDLVHLDVDCDVYPDDCTSNVLAIWAIEQHSGRKRGDT